MQNNGFGLTVKDTLKLLSLFCIVFTLMPAFRFTALAQTVDFKIMDIALGMDLGDGTKMTGNYVFLIYLIIPAVMLAILFLKLFTEEGNASVILVISALDIFLWTFLKTTIKSAVAGFDNLLKMTVWFILSYASLTIIFVIALMVVIKKTSMEMSITSILGGGRPQQTLYQMQATFNQMHSNMNQMNPNMNQMHPNMNQVNPNMNQMSGSMSAMQQGGMTNTANMATNGGFGATCSKCGAQVPQGVKFCTVCGTPVTVGAPVQPAPMKQEEPKVEAKAPQVTDASAQPVSSNPAQPEAKTETAAPKMKFCRICGTKLSSDAVFCDACGTKVE